MQLQNFAEVETSLGMEMKDQHTIVEKYPLGLKLKFGQAGAQEEFDALISTNRVATAR